MLYNKPWQVWKKKPVHMLSYQAMGIEFIVRIYWFNRLSTGRILFTWLLFLGFVSHLDVILIVLFLPKWQHDVPSSYHAWQIRKGKDIK